MNHRSNRLAKFLSVSTKPPVCDTCKGSGRERIEHSRTDGSSFEYTRRCYPCGGTGFAKRERR